VALPGARLSDVACGQAGKLGSMDRDARATSETLAQQNPPSVRARKTDGFAPSFSSQGHKEQSCSGTQSSVRLRRAHAARVHDEGLRGAELPRD